MRRHPARSAVVAALLLIVVALIWWGGAGSKGGGAPAAQAVPVVVDTARQGRFVVWQSQPGTVVPGNSVVVRSQVDGTLTRVAFQGGQAVKKGDLLAEVDPRPFQAQLQLASGDLARSQAQLAHAEEVLGHYRTLQEQDSISRQRVEEQQSLVSQYAAEVKAGQGRVDSARLQLSATRITSPIEGTVGLRRVDPGNLVGPADVGGITVVTQSQPSKVVFSMPVGVAAQVLKRLHEGACIPVEAWGDGIADRLDSGRLQAANNQVDPDTGTVRFEAGFANAGGGLLPNRFVTARLPVQVLDNAVMVPVAAVQQGADGPFVYVVKGDGKVAVAPVKPGPDDGTTRVIDEGVAAGARVVIEGADRLRAGTVVEAKAAVPVATGEVPVCHPDETSPSATGHP